MALGCHPCVSSSVASRLTPGSATSPATPSVVCEQRRAQFQNDDGRDTRGSRSASVSRAKTCAFTRRELVRHFRPSGHLWVQMHNPTTGEARPEHPSRRTPSYAASDAAQAKRARSTQLAGRRQGAASDAARQPTPWKGDVRLKHTAGRALPGFR